MIAGLKTVALSVVAVAIAGGVFGVFIGALTGDYLLWIGVLAFVGANLGLALAYGLLPES